MNLDVVGRHDLFDAPTATFEEHEYLGTRAD
jgi:hypothetical protein